MKKINIYSKQRNGKAVKIHSIDVASGEFGDAADAARAYIASLGPMSRKLFWNWADSAWDRRR
jgi:hypothetical protein